MTLAALQKSGTKHFLYTYDFGDSWEHTVLIERSTPAAAGQRCPACVAGERACPPEDCGGSWGYAELVDILADPNHPDRAERLEWLGVELDPEHFDMAAADAAVAAVFRRR